MKNFNKEYTDYTNYKVEVEKSTAEKVVDVVWKGFACLCIGIQVLGIVGMVKTFFDD